jgi:hypothetical protein
MEWSVSLLNCFTPEEGGPSTYCLTLIKTCLTKIKLIPVCVVFIADMGHIDVFPACSHAHFRNFQSFVDFRSCSFGI